MSTEPLQIVVYDQPEPCPYLSDQVARLPLRQPLQRLERSDLDLCLAAGDRRCGAFLYRTQCRSCQACEPIRIEVDRFQPSSSQRRAWRKGQRTLETQIGPAQVCPQRVELYNKHRRLRGLDDHSGEITASGYQDFLVDSCCETFEVCYRIDGMLAAVAIVDRGEQSLSAVYCYFDPELSQFSLGVYSILKQVELAREWGCRYLYLGLYIAGSRPMRYKAQYRPHERLLNGQWRKFGQPDATGDGGNPGKA